MASYMYTLKVILEEPTGVVFIPRDEGDTEYALEIELAAYYEWIWLLSYSEDVYAGTSYNIMRIENLTETITNLAKTGIVSGVTMVPYRTAVRIRGDLSKKIYLRGNGRVQIIAQNSESCPFSTGSCGF